MENVTAEADVRAYSASMIGYVEGPFRVLGPDHGIKTDGTVAQGATIPVISVRCNQVHTGPDGVIKANLREILPTLVAASGSNTNRAVNVDIVVNGTLTDPLWVDYGVGHSYACYDVSATGITGGDVILALGFSNNDSTKENLRNLEISVRPGDILSVVLSPVGTSVDYRASISWKEDS